MNIWACQTCGLEYDDAERSTICPHPLIMPREDLERKKLAIALIEKPIRFKHDVAGDSPFKPPLYISSIAWDGMVSLRGLEGYGQFAPFLFAEFHR